MEAAPGAVPPRRIGGMTLILLVLAFLVAATMITNGGIPKWDNLAGLASAPTLLTSSCELQPSQERACRDDGDRGGFKQVLFYIGEKEGIQPLSDLTLHAQANQDWIVASLLDCKRDGYFIDLAANDALDLSNTLALENILGWTGLCIEANPQYLPGLMRRRCTVMSAVVGFPTDLMVQFNLRGVLGGIVGEHFDNKATSNAVSMRLVSFRHLLSVVKPPPVIDYFSLDVEGAESMVMEDFPWSEVRFRVLTIERPGEDLKALLKDNGYHFLRTNSDFGDETWTDLEVFNRVKDRFIGALPTVTCMTELGY
jgi:hypothetical protein